MGRCVSATPASRSVAASTPRCRSCCRPSSASTNPKKRTTMPDIAQPAQPSQAERLAKALAARFLENGNYEALGMPLSHAAASKYVQASAVTELDEFFKEEEGFSG